MIQCVIVTAWGALRVDAFRSIFEPEQPGSTATHGRPGGMPTGDYGMPAHLVRATTTPAVIAPDGIPIHVFADAVSPFAGVAEGRFGRGVYRMHRHHALDQFTYVLAGTLTIVAGDGETGTPIQLAAGPGDLLLTTAGEVLQFINEEETEARVLFFCAPPYPPDNSDTEVLPLTAGSGMSVDPPAHALRRVRLLHTKAELISAFDARIAALGPPHNAPAS